MAKTKKGAQLSSGTMMFRIFRVLIAAALLVYLVRSMGGSADSTTSFEDMRAAVLQSADLTTMQEADNQMIRRLYGIDANNYESVMLYYPSTNMGAEEILLVHLSDKTQAEALLSAMESRKASQLSSFEGYGVEQTAMLEDSVCEVRGNYAIFVSAQNSSDIKSAFDAAY